jgi:hypothetical protein
MLKITIPAIEQYDEVQNEFVTSKETVLQLEHSLVSLSKWESKWHKPFLTKEDKTTEETIAYVKCMTITQNIPDDVYKNLTNKNVMDVRDYIAAEMTATTFANIDQKVTNREIITSEIIYYLMITLNIPFECQKWHLNRLLTLINVCNIKSAPPKKMGKSELMNRNATLNAARKQALNTKG